MSSSVRNKMAEISKTAKRARYAPKVVVVVESEVVNETPKLEEKTVIAKPSVKKTAKTKRKVSKTV